MVLTQPVYCIVDRGIYVNLAGIVGHAHCHEPRAQWHHRRTEPRKVAWQRPRTPIDGRSALVALKQLPVRLDGASRVGNVAQDVERACVGVPCRDLESGKKLLVHERLRCLECCRVDVAIDAGPGVQLGHRAGESMEVSRSSSATRSRSIVARLAPCVGSGERGFRRHRDRQSADEATHTGLLPRRVRRQRDADLELAQGVDAHATFVIVGETVEKPMCRTAAIPFMFTQSVDTTRNLVSKWITGLRHRRDRENAVRSAHRSSRASHRRTRCRRSLGEATRCP